MPPAPLVAADVDLRGYSFMPLYRQRLLTSRFNNLASDSEFRAGLLLWVAAWDQLPSGSLPTDDRELAILAGLGRDLRQWRKVKKWALHNWHLCDDGRLYHPVVAETVNDAWERTEANRHRTQAARAAKRQRSHIPVTEPVIGSPPLDPPLTKQNKTTRAREGNGVDHEGDLINDSGSLGSLRSPGRSAPLEGVKGRRKAQLVQKLMRYTNATLQGDEQHAAFRGLMGLDEQHSAQWWLDTLDQAMRKAKWDDANEAR
jgi:hypothetical protein